VLKGREGKVPHKMCACVQAAVKLLIADFKGRHTQPGLSVTDRPLSEWKTVLSQPVKRTNR